MMWLCVHRGDWDMEARMAKVVEACRVANCLDFIEHWPQGFDTVSEPQHL
jgi:ABC-type multidrug transport system fused ATPase/permease subunit